MIEDFLNKGLDGVDNQQQVAVEYSVGSKIGEGNQQQVAGQYSVGTEIDEEGNQQGGDLVRDEESFEVALAAEDNIVVAVVDLQQAHHHIQ